MSFWCPMVILAKVVKGLWIDRSFILLENIEWFSPQAAQHWRSGSQAPLLQLPPHLLSTEPRPRDSIWASCDLLTMESVVSTLPERTPTASLLPQSFFWCTGLKQPRAVAWQSLPNPGQAVLGSCSQVGELILGDFQLLHLSAQAAWTGQAAAAKNQSQDFVNNLMKVLGALVPAVANLWAGQTVAHTSTASQKKTRSQVGIFFWSPSQK